METGRFFHNGGIGMEANYPTDLTDEQWQAISRLIPPAKPGGRPREVNHPAGVEWAVLHRSHGLCVADVAEGVSAEGHGVLLLQGIPPRRYVGAYS